MPLCKVNVIEEKVVEVKEEQDNASSQPKQEDDVQTSSGYSGGGSGNRIVQAALKWYDKYLPRGATHGTSKYYCNALVGCVLQDIGVWKSYSNANGNLNLLRNDNRFVEIKYTSGEKAKGGDIMCIERNGKSGHNMICIDANSDGKITKILSAGSTSDKKGQNHVDWMVASYPSPGSADYKNLHLFRLK